MVGLVLAVALAVTGAIFLAEQRRAERSRVTIAFVPGCCEGVATAQLEELDGALRSGALRAVDWEFEQVLDEHRSLMEGTLALRPDPGGPVASLRVRVADGHAERIDVMGMDSDALRARRVHEQVQAGEHGEAVPYVAVAGCSYDIDAAALRALLGKLAMGGVPRVPTRLRPDYTFNVDWPGVQVLDGHWLVSWRKGKWGAPRLLLAVEDTRGAAVAKAGACLARVAGGPRASGWLRHLGRR